MLDTFRERMAARKDPRFRAFVEGKKAYESFQQALCVPFHAMSEDHYRIACEDSRLNIAMERFTAAITMSEQAGALADAAVASYQLGLVRHARGELDKARESIRTALGVMINLPNRDRLADVSGCYYHLGVIAMKQGHLPKAVRELRRSRRLDEANSDLAGMHICDEALAACAHTGADIVSSTPEAPEEVSGWEPSEDAEEPVAEKEPPPEPQRETDPVRYNQREVILLVSHSVEANDTLMVHLNKLGNEFGRPVSISRAAVGASDPGQRQLRQLDADQHPCAAILILEKAGIPDPAFQELAAVFMRRVMAVPDFRLLVYLHDLTMEELRGLSDRDRFIATLFDTTQIAQSPSLDQLRRTLVPYVRRVERIRAEALWRGFRLRMASLCGRLTTAVLIAAVLIALLGFPAWLLKLPLNWLGPHGPSLAAFVLGLLAFPLQAPLIFLLLRGMRITALAPRDNVSLMRWVGVGFVVMLGATHFQHTLGGPNAWLFLGLASGVVLDSIRRAGSQARRQAIDLETLLERAADPTLQDPRTTVRQGDPLNPFSCPLLPSQTSRVFISYTRSSSKGVRLATDLHRKLKEVGASPFLDRASIPAGANWRRVLNRHLGECDVFLCILDERSVQREWVTAEVLAALKARRLTGGPEIVLLMDPAIQGSSQPMLPVFQGIVSAAADPPIPGRPQIVTINAQTPRALAWGLAPGRFAPRTVFTRGAVLPVMYATLVLGILGGLGIFSGFILGFLAMLEVMSKFPFSSVLANRGLLAPITLLTAFWLGFTARVGLACGYEWEHRREMGMAMPIIAAAGLAYALFLFVPKASVLVAGWSAVFVAAGWLMVASTARNGGSR